MRNERQPKRSQHRQPPANHKAKIRQKLQSNSIRNQINQRLCGSTPQTPASTQAGNCAQAKVSPFNIPSKQDSIHIQKTKICNINLRISTTRNVMMAKRGWP
ncbi:hypothetical protein V6N13_129864 [Hibiscus sabdariffa]|uniref:Uncharacterized protein n=1 Tax=Hibiscus sabdariffa TaxID=183260 RepID=A0ABR2SMI4_9ROSI